MSPHYNLISDSILIKETIELLKAFGGRATAKKVVERVMRISNSDADLAKLLVADLVASDPRLNLSGDSVELIENNSDKRKFSETSFVVFDLETTGAKISAVPRDGNRRVSRRGRENYGRFSDAG